MFACVGHAGARRLNAASYCIYVESSSRDVIYKSVGERPQKDEGKERAQFWENRPNSSLRAARWAGEALYLGSGTREAGGSRVGCHVSRPHLPLFGGSAVMPQPQEWNQLQVPVRSAAVPPSAQDHNSHNAHTRGVARLERRGLGSWAGPELLGGAGRTGGTVIHRMRPGSKS